MTEKHFSCIAIISKPVEVLTEHVRNVLTLVQASGATALLDSNSVRDLGPDCDYTATSLQETTQKADAVITIGGDGTMLGAARAFAKTDTPIIGVNAGRLGFITDIPVNKIHEELPAILAGNYCYDKRPMIQGTLYRQGKPVFSSYATNDIGLCHGRALGMVEYSLYVDDTLLSIQRADGIIISTATGSTAYAMSAGGPIMHPALGALLLVPIAPHTLSNRPVLVPRSSTVRVVVTETRSAVASFDAQVFFDVLVGDVLEIGTATDSHFVMLHPQGFNQYDMWHKKLNWSLLPYNDFPVHERI